MQSRPVTVRHRSSKATVVAATEAAFKERHRILDRLVAACSNGKDAGDDGWDEDNLRRVRQIANREILGLHTRASELMELSESAAALTLDPDDAERLRVETAALLGVIQLLSPFVEAPTELMN